MAVATYIVLLLASVALCAGAGVKTNQANTNWDYSYPYQRTKLGKKSWFYGSATFYSFSGNSGACGYPWSAVNGYDTAAVPDARWADLMTNGVANVAGAACGTCYWIKCLNVPRYGGTVFCKSQKPVLVRVVDYDVPGDHHGGAWPNNHFDLQPQTFSKIAHPEAGILNVKFKRGWCRSSTAKWTLSPASNAFWKDVIIFDVPGVGNVHRVFVKPASRKKWYKGNRLWGAHFTFMGGGTFDAGAKVMAYLAESQGSLRVKYKQTS